MKDLQNTLKEKSLEEMISFLELEKKKLQKASTYRNYSLLAGSLLYPTFFFINHPINFFLANSNFMFWCLQFQNTKKHRENIYFFTKNIQEFFLNSYDYEEINQLFHLFLYDFLQFADQYHIKTPMEIFSMYYYFLQKGYLSLPHEFYYSSKDREEICMFYDLNVFEGKASCRNISPFLANLLKIKGFDSCNASIFLSNETELISFSQEDLLFDVNEVLEVRNPNVNKINSEITSNHVITYLHDNDSTYFMDATNNTLYLVNENQYLTSMGTNCEIKKIHAMSIFNQNKKSSISLTPTKEDLIDLQNQYLQGFNICENSKDSIEQFYQEHCDLYKEILEKKNVLYKKQGNFYEKTIGCKINDYH